MKDLKLLLFLIPVLAACAGPATAVSTPTNSRKPATEPVYIGSVSPMTPSTSKGEIEGTISWLTSDNPAEVPVQHVNLELNGHEAPNPRYTAKTDLNGHYSFENVEPNSYGIGIYLSLPVGERLCEAPEYQYTHDLDWLHYATALRGEIWYDILFSSKDVVVHPGAIVYLDLTLKCP